ncbi:MAG: OprD family porin [Gammaproteobacteria bacterium]|nr:OprD family porin [Gammaproteobacteria bacterium]
MKHAIKWTSVALAVAMGNGLIAAQATAGEGFVEGASADLTSRTFYFNRDFRNNNQGQSKADETAQGFILNFESGFTEGPIGFGADITALMGIKLDSGGGTTGTGLLPTRNNGKAPGEYSHIRGAAKMQILEDTEVRYGTHFVDNPVIAYDDIRLLPSHYFGYSVSNSSIDGLFVELGRMTHRSDMEQSSQDSRAFIDTDDNGDLLARGNVTYLGGSYQFNPALAASVYSSKADNLWRRHHFGLSHSADLGNGMTLGTDLSHYHTSDRSNNNLDYGNKATSLAVTLGAGYHAITGAYQRMSGNAGYEYFDGAVYLANSVQVLDFNAKDERSWHAAYQYDFAGAGIPGLGFTARYIRGSNIDADFYGATSDTRWERNFALDYTIQSGALAGLNLKWMNATVRQDRNLVVRQDRYRDRGDIDENRVVASYTWNLL